MKTDSSDFVDEIVSDTVPQHIAPRAAAFAPWHKIRKQVIRAHQWNKFVYRLVQKHLGQLQKEPADWSLDDETASGEVTMVPDSVRFERPLRCLVIPGDDLLDVRSMWHSIRDLKCFVRYIGFNDRHGSNDVGTRIHVANNAVTSLDRVAGDSLVIADRFQSIAGLNNQAYRYLKEYGPFHVVNLDLCDSLLPTTADEAMDYYNALLRLTDYQMKNQTTPWLLFMTTQIEPGKANRSGLEKLCKPTRQNCDDHPDFACRLRTVVPQQAFSARTSVVDVASLTNEQLIHVFGVALGKWLNSLAASARPSWTLHMLPSYRYKIRVEPQVEMLSLAFQFRPRRSPPVDTTGLSNLKLTGSPGPTELECAIQLLSVMEKLADVDGLLTSNAVLRDEMEAASACLMEEAGFDRTDYLDWVRSGEGYSIG